MSCGERVKFDNDQDFIDFCEFFSGKKLKSHQINMIKKAREVFNETGCLKLVFPKNFK